MNDFNLHNRQKISSGFITPDGYFDAFPEQVLVQLPKDGPKVIPISGRRKIWYTVAAAVVVLMISLPLYNRYSGSQEQIDAATLENYLAYQSNISEEEIIKLLNQEDIDKMRLELNLDDREIEDALQYNSNLEEYIID